MYFLSMIRAQQVRHLGSQGETSKNIAYQLGMTESEVTRIRRGLTSGTERVEMDPPLAWPSARRQARDQQLPVFRIEADPPPASVVWCPRCRCHVIPPCQCCRVAAYRQHQSLRADAGVRPAQGSPHSRDRLARTQPIPRAPIPPERAGPAAPHDPRLNQGVGELAIPNRLVGYLAQHDVLTVGQLLNCTPSWLLSLPNLGRRSLNQIYAALEQIGFHRQP